MSNLSQYENTNNPLTEVALALAMAFFSIMILSIFTLSNASLNAQNHISITNNANDKKNEEIKRIPIYFYNDKFYNSKFNTIELTQLSQKKKYLLFIPTEISVEKLFFLRSKMENKDVKVSKILMKIKKILQSKVIREKK
ncbi:hypothetical protein OBA40_03645 [Alphaproteobacteria bacterium]|nr:hypothetical protein [Alphaproteobacteria bacterium]